MNAFFILIFSIPTWALNSAPWLNENMTDVAMLEGDMVTGNDPHDESTYQCPDCQHAGVPKRSTKLWDGKTIPYMYSPEFKARQIKLIMSAMEEIEEKTCVGFVPRNGQKNFIHFNLVGDKGACASNVGKVGKRQYVNLTDDCVTPNTVLHELAHVLGFYHEHNRYDRDNFIQVILENVVPEKRNQYQIITPPETLFLEYNIPYDYSSITHYSEDSNSANGKKTILTKQPYGIIPPPSVHLSHYDVIKINLLYNCTDLIPPKASMEENSTTAIDADRDLDIFAATQLEKVERVKMLLKGGSDVNERDGKDKNKTALHFATRTNGRSIMLILLNRFANIEAKDDEGLTPLHYASIDGKTDIAAVLISRGANVDVRSNNNTTPLHFAAKFGHLNCISLLLNNLANVEPNDDHGWTPLHVAAQCGYSNVASVLMNNLANMTTSDKVGRLPLHIAAAFGHVNVVSLLLNNSANVESKDNNAWTPLHHASFHGHTSTVLLLLDNGANIFAKTAGNQVTALDLARLRNRVEVKGILEQKQMQFRLLFLKSYLEAVS